MNILEILENIERLIQAGQQQPAREALALIKPSQVSPVDLVYFCSLLRRVSLSVQVITLLQPLIYPQARSAASATHEEKLEYASNLVRLGILNEAERLLNTIDSVKYPTVLIRKGFLAIAKWDYEKANAFFDSYVHHPVADKYNIAIAKVNFLQGLVHLRKLDLAWALAQDLLISLDRVQNKLLLAAVYEFAAEIHRLKGDQKKALQFIDEGKTLLRDSKSIDEFLLRKQEQIIRRDVAELKKLKKEARERNHQESVRDLDFHIALMTKDSRLLNTVFWKTESVAYKQRLISHAQEQGLQLNLETYSFGKNKGITFDLETHLLSGAKSELKKGKAIARLLKALLVEGYKPLKIIDLFAMVFEDEIFFPDSSADKMHQLIRRLRLFLKAADLPLKLACENENYSIIVHGSFTLNRNQTYRTEWEISLARYVKSGYFKVATAQKVWDCSLRTTLRRLSELKLKSSVRADGQTRSVKYRFISS